MANQSKHETPANAEDTMARAAYSSLKEDSKAMRDTASETGKRLEEEAEEYLSEGGAELDEMITKAEFAIIDHPLAAVGIAFAAGWLTARLFR